MSSWRANLQSQAQQRFFSDQQSRFKFRERSGISARLNATEDTQPLPAHSKTTVLRLRGLPTDKAKLDKIETRLKQEPDLKRLEIIPDCMKDEGHVALLDWRGEPGTGPFESTFKEPGDTCYRELEGKNLSLDQHFHGFTQLYPVFDPDSIQADIVAISGLDAHAYGSFRGSKTGDMWLRDFLKTDLPNCRTMIWGYDVKLNAPADHDLADYSTQFFSDLKRIRPTNIQRRPLILIGFSYGGRIVVRALIESKLDEDNDGDEAKAMFYKSTYGILFFGTPHRGMYNEDLLENLSEPENYGRRSLVESVNTYKDELTRFKNIIRDRKIISCVEKRMTQALEMVDGKLQRSGHYNMMVEEAKALVGLPSCTEQPLLLNVDHRSLAKFETPEDQGYWALIDYLKHFVKDAPDAVAARFSKSLPLGWPSSVDTGRTSKLHHTNIDEDGKGSGIRAPVYEFPKRLVSEYVQREGLFGELSELFDQDPIDGEQPRRVALRGLPGAGKSQLALKYCEEASQSGEYSYIIWLASSSPEGLEHEIQSAMKKICGPGASEKHTIGAMHEMLKGCEKRWLIVFDNFDFPPLFKKGLKEYYPTGRNGRVLITSQRGMRDHVEKEINVGEVTEEEGLSILFSRMESADAELQMQDGKKLLKRLQYLCYPIHCVARFIAGGIYTVDQYLSNINSGANETALNLEGNPEYQKTKEGFVDDSGHNAPTSVFQTFRMCLQAFEGAFDESGEFNVEDEDLAKDPAGAPSDGAHELEGVKDLTLVSRETTEDSSQTVESNQETSEKNQAQSKDAVKIERAALMRILLISSHIYRPSIPTSWWQRYGERAISKGTQPWWMNHFTTNGEWDHIKFCAGVNKLIQWTLLQQQRVGETSKTGEFSLHNLMRDTLKARMRGDRKMEKSTLLDAMRLLWENYDHAWNNGTGPKTSDLTKCQCTFCSSHVFEKLMLSTMTGKESADIEMMEPPKRTDTLDSVLPGLQVLQAVLIDEGYNEVVKAEMKRAQSRWRLLWLPALILNTGPMDYAKCRWDRRRARKKNAAG
ncbi:MAG: hypothetical protein M1828_005509 [Chrysothrix sp. TS-e1954]|nr:MAG: hypothetical protein M1828_005509 [Chrysothrix sp. TS-e1954]